MNIPAFPAFLQDRRAVLIAATIPCARTAVGQRDLGHFPCHSDMLFPSVAFERMIIGRLMLALAVAAVVAPR